MASWSAPMLDAEWVHKLDMVLVEVSEMAWAAEKELHMLYLYHYYQR